MCSTHYVIAQTSFISNFMGICDPSRQTKVTRAVKGKNKGRGKDWSWRAGRVTNPVLHLPLHSLKTNRNVKINKESQASMQARLDGGLAGPVWARCRARRILAMRLDCLLKCSDGRHSNGVQRDQKEPGECESKGRVDETSGNILTETQGHARDEAVLRGTAATTGQGTKGQYHAWELRPPQGKGLRASTMPGLEEVPQGTSACMRECGGNAKSRVVFFANTSFLEP